MIFKIETERLIIRDITPDDFPTLLKRKIEPSARPNILYQESAHINTKEELKNAFAWSIYEKQRKYYKLAVFLKTNGALLGTCGIYDVYPESIAMIGWHYESKFANQGYATEAAQELLYIGFEINQVSIIYADSFADNTASIRIMEKLGMNPDWSIGSVSKLNGNGENKLSVRYRVMRKEWLNRQG